MEHFINKDKISSQNFNYLAEYSNSKELQKLSEIVQIGRALLYERGEVHEV